MLFRLYRHWLSAYLGIPRTIWFLAFINLINRCGGMVISFITLYLTQRLHFSIAEAGYVMGFFGLGALLGAYLGGRLTDKFGYFWVQFWSLFFNGILLLVLMLVEQFWPMCAAVFVMSVISEVFRPANSVSIAQNSEPETRTRSISLYRMSANLGWTIAPTVGGLLVVFGWHWLFWVDGLTCIMAAFLLLSYLPIRVGKPSVATAPTPSIGLESETSPTPDPVQTRSPYRDREYLWFILLTLLNAVVFMQILWTVPVFFKEVYQWSERQIGLMVALNGLIVFLVEMPLIHRIEGKKPPLVQVRIGLLLYILAYLAFVVPFGPFVAAVLFMIAISLGEIFVMPFSSNYSMGRSGKYNQGQYMGLYVMAYSVSNVIAPLFGTQVIAAWGYHTLWYLVVALAGIVWVGFGLLERRSASRRVLPEAVSPS